MEVIVAGSLVQSAINQPIDKRSRVASLSDIEDIENPVLGGIVYCISTGSFYIITALKSKTIGALTVPNAAVDTYEKIVFGLVRTIVSSNTNAAPGHWYLCSDDITITLPEGSSGMNVKISTIGTADEVTINPASGETIEGDTAFLLDAANNSVELVYNGSQWVVAEVVAN